MNYIGIDPGVTGAVAALRRTPSGPAVQVWDTPVIKSKKTEYDLAGMVNILAREDTFGCHAIIESVHSMPGQGVSSSFGFGKGFGMWLGILAALQIPYTLVTPQRWKKAMMDGMPKEKAASRLRAQQLFPLKASEFTRQKDDGRAEALLMAEWGRRQLSPVTENVTNQQTYSLAEEVF